jgi:hypothetical protein
MNKIKNLSPYLYLSVSLYLLYQILSFSGDIVDLISKIIWYVISCTLLSLYFENKSLDQKIFNLRNKESYLKNEIMNGITEQIGIDCFITQLMEEGKT